MLIDELSDPIPIGSPGPKGGRQPRRQIRAGQVRRSPARSGVRPRLSLLDLPDGSQIEIANLPRLRSARSSQTQSSTASSASMQRPRPLPTDTHARPSDPNGLHRGLLQPAPHPQRSCCYRSSSWRRHVLSSTQDGVSRSTTAIRHRRSYSTGPRARPSPPEPIGPCTGRCNEPRGHAHSGDESSHSGEA